MIKRKVSARTRGSLRRFISAPTGRRINRDVGLIRAAVHTWIISVAARSLRASDHTTAAATARRLGDNAINCSRAPPRKITEAARDAPACVNVFFAEEGRIAEILNAV